MCDDRAGNVTLQAIGLVTVAMLSLLTQSNRLKYFLVDCLGLHIYIYIYVINVVYKIQLAITYTSIHHNGYLWSSPLKGLAQAKIIKKSVILFRVLNMTI